MNRKLWRPPRLLRRAANPTMREAMDQARRRALPDPGPESRDRRAGFFEAWGNSPLNHLADRAGRHRRVAIGFSLLVAPMVMMGVALVIEGGFLLFSLAHLIAAGCFLWVAWDLIRWAALVGRRQIPHTSVLALFLAFGLLHYSCPPDLRARFGSMTPLMAGLLTLGFALLVLTIDDRHPNPLVALTGRSALILGGATVGFAELARMAVGIRDYPLYALGSGGAGLLLAAMACFEGRLAYRAVMLVYASNRRNRV